MTNTTPVLGCDVRSRPQCVPSNSINTLKKTGPARKTTSSVVVAILIFGINIGPVYVNEHKSLVATIEWGIVGWMVPFICYSIWIVVSYRVNHVKPENEKSDKSGDSSRLTIFFTPQRQ